MGNLKNINILPLYKPIKNLLKMKFTLLFAILLACLAYSQASVPCATQSFAIASDAILVSGKYNVQLSDEDCQASCQAITDCTYWSWFTSSHPTAPNYCTLHYSITGIPQAEVTSGPKFC